MFSGLKSKIKYKRFYATVRERERERGKREKKEKRKIKREGFWFETLKF